MGKVLLVLQEGNEPVPLDYRDLVSSYTFPNQIDDYISRFATDVMADLQTSSRLAIREPGTFLSTLNLGAVSAENEFRDLGQYYLRTDEFRRALRGEARIVVGRKGSGKTALFAQLRDILRDDRGNVVLDLKPEAYQLKKFKEETLALMAEGTQEHTLTAFWEYLLVLEICFKLLEKDALPHVRDHRLYEPYRRLAELYNSDEYVTEGDFSERLAKILQSISFEHKSKHGTNPGVKLNDAQLTEMLYRHDYAVLRDSVIDYLKLKNEVWILIDNLDKGWATHGVDDDDLRMIRCLLEASRKLDREMAKADVACHAMIFIRNDVYELLVAKTPDRGKEARLPLDWNDGDLLRELLRRRLIYNEGVERKASFDEIWRSICASHIRGEETSQYIIDRSLMRPRYLLNFVNQAKSHAVNLGKDKIEPEDIEKGESIYSTDLVTDISYEINDVFPKAGDILYEFLEWEMDIQHDYLLEIVREKGFDNGDIQKLVDMLLWFGFIGLVRENGEASYIHDVNYDFRRLATLIERRKKVGVVYRINPAFWAGLEVTRHKAS
jgi:energy-coupling factor transporter ATP-binding protein EcfA2